MVQMVVYRVLTVLCLHPGILRLDRCHVGDVIGNSTLQARRLKARAVSAQGHKDGLVVLQSEPGLSDLRTHACAT